MKRLSFFIAMMLSCLTSFAQIEITEAQALQLVKNQYPSSTVFDFYIAETDTIFDDGDDSCILDSIPLVGWLNDSSAKWLIFVDERPMTGWSHPCSYFYIPKNYSPQNGNDIPFVKFKGSKYPRKINLELLESQRVTVRDYQVPNRYLSTDYRPFTNQRTEEDEEEYKKPIVIMIGGGYVKENNYYTYWNDCEYLYNVLRQDYGMDSDCFLSFFPTLQLRTFGYENYISRPNYYNNEVPEYQLMYLNRKDVILEKLYDFYLMEENLPYKNSNLIFYITCHGEIDPRSNEPYICLLDASNYIDHPTVRDNRLYATELDSIATVFGARNTTFILQNCYSGAFIDYLQGPGRTIITACSEDECSESLNPHLGIEHNEFSYHFTNAIRQADIYGTPVNSDTDSNGRVTMKEAFVYAQSHDEGDETPMYCSTPEWLGEEFSFDYAPDTTSFFIRDNLQDVGSNIHSSTGNYWNSPDIWVRNSDDGFSNQENDHLLVGSDEKLYVYVRVNNRGYRDYIDPSKYLHLYWKTNSLNLSSQTLFDTGSEYGGKITALNLDTAISAEDSHIFRYTWQLPASLVSRAAANGSILDIEVMALVNDTTTAAVPEDVSGMIALRENSNVALRKENRILPGLGVRMPRTSQFEPPKRQVRIPIYINQTEANVANKITLEVDSASVGNVFGYSDLFLELSPGIYAASSSLPKSGITTTASAPRKYKLNGNGSYFSFTVPQSGIDSLVFYCEYSDLHPVTDINALLHLKTTVTDSLIDAETFSLHIAAITGGGSGPGIIMLNGNDGSSQLVATGVNEPSELEWYSPEQDLLGDSETLELPANRQQGVYTLRVASRATGAVNYATQAINDGIAIDGITPNPFSTQFTVRLTQPAPTGTMLRLSPVSGNGRDIEVPVAAGEREAVISAVDCPSGIYAVGLLVDNVLKNSTRVVKN